MVSGFWLGMRLILSSDPPLTFISSNYMEIRSEQTNEWEINLFGMSLCVGDLVFVEWADAEKLYSNYPNSDIVVFHNPDAPNELAALRMVSKTKIDGKWYFFVKGDGVGSSKWPAEVDLAQCVEWKNQDESLPSGAVSEDLIVGKVVLRVPLAGALAVFVHESFGVNDSFVAVALPLIFVLFVFVVSADFVVPFLLGQMQDVQQKRQRAPR